MIVKAKNLLLGKYCTRWWIRIEKGLHYQEVIYLHSTGGVDMMKCLKKAWKHYSKAIPRNLDPEDRIEVYAFYEGLDGDVSEVSLHWIYEQVEYLEEKDLLPIPFLW